MKIVNFTKMLTLPVGTIFCLVDVPDDFQLGPLCRKEDTDHDKQSFDYRHVGSLTAQPEDEDERMEYNDAAYDTLTQGFEFSAGFDDDTLMVETIDHNPLCCYAIYSDYELERMIATLQLARDLNVRTDLHPSGGQS